MFSRFFALSAVASTKKSSSKQTIINLILEDLIVIIIHKNEDYVLINLNIEREDEDVII